MSRFPRALPYFFHKNMFVALKEKERRVLGICGEDWGGRGWGDASPKQTWTHTHTDEIKDRDTHTHRERKGKNNFHTPNSP